MARVCVEETASLNSPADEEQTDETQPFLFSPCAPGVQEREDAPAEGNLTRSFLYLDSKN